MLVASEKSLFEMKILNREVSNKRCATSYHFIYKVHLA